MERQRRQQQEAAAAAVLHAALVYLNRNGLCKEPFSPAMFAKPNLKALQATLHLLYYRIRGATRTKKDLQHMYPVLEQEQAREFKAAMQEWIRELGAANLVLPDTVKYFVTAYQGSNSHRTVLMLLDLSTVALSRELGEGPQATLPDLEQVQPNRAANRARPLPASAQQAAGAALRLHQGMMDEVVAVMQRLKQLQAQVAGQLAAGRGAGGQVAAQLAPRVPPLFLGSQASARRGELVLELLSQGPPLTAQPEAVGSDSWSDLLAAGRTAAAASAAGGPAAPGAAAGARRLSNPAQEASNFAAEGLAADADVLTVQRVVTQRCAAVGSTLQAASAAGPGSVEVRGALAEAAVYREVLMLSVRHELASGKLRAEQAAASSSSRSSNRPSMLQLLPPSLPPCNPVLEGMQATQQAAAAADAEVSHTISGSSGWLTAGVDAMQALRRSMWQAVQTGTAACSSKQPVSPIAVPHAAIVAGTQPAAATAASPSPLQLAAACPAAGGGSSNSSKPPNSSSRRAAERCVSPDLADLLSNSSGLAALPLLSEELDVPPEAAFGSAPPPQQAWERSHQQQQLLLGSPCMAESCASASVAADGHGHRSSGSNVSSAGRVHASSSSSSSAASSMLSAAASFMPSRQQGLEQQPQQQEAGRYMQPSSSLAPAPAAAAAAAALRVPALLRLDSFSPASSPQATPRRLASISTAAGSPAGAALSWRQTAAASAAAAAAGAAAATPGSSSRRRASTILTTPPRRLLDSPVQQQQQQHSGPLGSPIALRVDLRDEGDSTPVSKLYSSSRVGPGSGTSSPSPVLQPVQQQQQRGQAHGRAAPAVSQQNSPGSELLATCFKPERPNAPLSPFAPAVAGGSPAWGTQQQQRQQQQQPGQRRVLPAACSPSPAPAAYLSSPRGGSRRRSSVVTTTSPLAMPRSLDSPPTAHHQAHRLAGGGDSGGSGSSGLHTPVRLAAAGGNPLLSPPRLLDTPAEPGEMVYPGGSPTGQQQQHSRQFAATWTPPRLLCPTPGVPAGQAQCDTSAATGHDGADGSASSLAAFQMRLAMLDGKVKQ